VSWQLIGHQYTSQEIDPLDETRSSSETSYLHEASTSSSNNFQVYPDRLAKRIIFSPNNTATGVQVRLRGRRTRLLRLENLSIPVIADRPGVGQNMWDHVESGSVYPVDVGNVAKYTVPALLPAATEEYLVNKTGVLTGAGFNFIG
jgi:choline dehydrogenase